MGKPRSITQGDIQEVKPIRIMIAFNDKYVCDGLGTYISAQENFKVVAEVSSVLDVFRQYTELNPDLILMDLVFPGGNGIDVTKALQEIAPEAKVILFTSSRGTHLLPAAQAAGATRFLNMGISGEKLVETIHEVMVE